MRFRWGYRRSTMRRWCCVCDVRCSTKSTLCWGRSGAAYRLWWRSWPSSRGRSTDPLERKHTSVASVQLQHSECGVEEGEEVEGDFDDAQVEDVRLLVVQVSLPVQLEEDVYSKTMEADVRHNEYDVRSSKCNFHRPSTVYQGSFTSIPLHQDK